MNAIEPIRDHASALEVSPQERRDLVGAAADAAARASVFARYAQGKAANTRRRQRADLALFAEYLASVQDGASAEALTRDAAAWAGMTYGLIAGFVPWQLQRGYAVASVNVRLSTVKQYAMLAFQAGTITAEQHTLIRTVQGYQHKEKKHVDAQRVQDGTGTRIGAKKAKAVTLTKTQVVALKIQPDTPQGRRDALILAILLDLGLRVGELALLEVGNVNLADMTIRFYRPKVDKVQTLDLNTRDLKRALSAWFAHDAPTAGKLLRGRAARAKGTAVGDGAALGSVGMTERAITKRVEHLGRKIGVEGLSAHDLRHSWATRFARLYKQDTFGLQESGGWNSLAMPRRYVEAAKVANEGYSLDED